MVKFLRLTSLVVPVTGALLSAAACSGPDSSSSQIESTTAVDDSAPISMNLDLAPGVTVNSAS